MDAVLGTSGISGAWAEPVAMIVEVGMEGTAAIVGSRFAASIASFRLESSCCCAMSRACHASSDVGCHVA